MASKFTVDMYHPRVSVIRIWTSTLCTSRATSDNGIDNDWMSCTYSLHCRVRGRRRSSNLEIKHGPTRPGGIHVTNGIPPLNQSLHLVPVARARTAPSSLGKCPLVFSPTSKKNRHLSFGSLYARMTVFLPQHHQHRLRICRDAVLLTAVASASASSVPSLNPNP